MQRRSPGQGMRIYLLIWFGQVVSMFGSGLTGFALGVWVFKQTGSATQLTLISFFATLPFIIFAPVAGALVDRWDRRWALILSEAGAALTPLAILVLLELNQFAIWQIYLVTAISSIFRSFQFPAFSAATTLLVPKEQYGRASGMTQLGVGIAQLLSPVMAGVLVGAIGLAGIFLIDVITFVFSVLTLLIARIPKPEISAAGQEGRGSLLRESTYGWHYITARPGLLGLLLFFAASNFMSGAVIALATPLVLSFSTPPVLGTILSVAGVGILVGSLVMSVWGGPKHRVYGVLGGVLLSGVCIFIAGLAPSALLIGTMAFFFTVGTPIVAASSQAIWQHKVAPDVQGRVFATRGMIATASLPLAYLVSGPLADYVFNPLLVPNGPLAGSVGRIIGVGPGRGIGLLFMVLGLLNVLAVSAGAQYPRIRYVEQELPDAVLDEPSLGAERPIEVLAGSQPQVERV